MKFAMASLILVLLTVPGMATGQSRLRTWSFDGTQSGQVSTGFASETGRWEVSMDGDNAVLFQRGEMRCFRLRGQSNPLFPDGLFSLELRW